MAIDKGLYQAPEGLETLGQEEEAIEIEIENQTEYFYFFYCLVY